MTTRIIMKVLAVGDVYGSALRELALYYGAENYDLSRITDEMALRWLEGRNKND